MMQIKKINTDFIQLICANPKNPRHLRAKKQKI
jgi:hypothetical protein